MRSGKQYGWGEATPWKYPAYSSECASGVFMMIRDFLAPLLLGKEIGSGQELQQRLGSVKGNHFAKAALDLAWWDLYAKSCNKPLWKLLGGQNPVVNVGPSFGIMDNIDALLQKIDTVVKAGFKRVKLKYCHDWGLNMIAAVRKAFPNTVFHIDCNSAFTLDDLDMFKALDQYHLAMIEQPLMHDDLIDHAELQRQIQTPVCLDESITSADKARKAIQIGACRWINIKLGRVGGVTPAMDVYRVCEKAGLPTWVGGMGESALGQANSLAVATLPNNKYPSDIFPSSQHFHEDLSNPPSVLSGPSQVTALDAPGVGTEPNQERLEKLTVQRATLPC
jgi:O-succinylbenzoate synthase